MNDYYPISGATSSLELCARVGDFMERADELLNHELAEYQAALHIHGTLDEDGQQHDVDMDYNVLDREPLVYFATILRPILFASREPIYYPTLVASIGREHPALQAHTRSLGRSFIDWRRTNYVGAQPFETPGPARDDVRGSGWVGRSRTLPAGAYADDFTADFYYATIYLNGFVWRDDSGKTAEYHAAGSMMQDHYRKCAETRVFSGLQLLVKELHRWITDARSAGEDF